ncbi:MAG: 4-hydroxy-tetrahydrodipicolinate synthase [Desulfobacteraceae bacterium]|nr:4-hydroxy-tetrahydrodipicolinate synthase [Desulfobacteraceae bacterium]
MKPGCYTALVTPFTSEGQKVDHEGFEKLAAFQIQNGITGILAVGTTGESPTLSWQEHDAVVEKSAQLAKGRCLTIAGTGSNNTQEALTATEHAVKLGVDAALLVDPYYSGPSSLEIRREYIGPIAKRFPEMQLIPYVVPGRTGAQLLPEDLGLLSKQYPNVSSVKEATTDLDNMRRTRECCKPEFTIFSGDDAMTYDMMTDSSIAASGVISVVGNLAPHSVTRMVELITKGDIEGARAIRDAIEPLFGLVTVSTQEQTPYGPVLCRARNPLAIKTLMRLLGMPSGPCRKPLGKMSRQGLDYVVGIGRKVWTQNPEVLQPIEEFFGVDISERLNNPKFNEELFYSSY